MSKGQAAAVQGLQCWTVAAACVLSGASACAAIMHSSKQLSAASMWEAVGDGLDELRQRLREHTPLGREQKLQLARKELREEEARLLERFAGLLLPLVHALPRPAADRGTTLQSSPLLPNFSRPCQRTTNWPVAGNLLGRDRAHSNWKYTSKQLQLLQLDPDEFIRNHGWQFSLEE